MSKTIFAFMLLLALNAGASVTAFLYHVAGERRESWRSSWNR